MHFSDICKNNPSLKPTLKYLVYCQLLWVKVRRLQDQIYGSDLYRRWCFITSFQISCNKKNFTRNVKSAFSQTMLSSKIYHFPYTKNKSY